MTKNERQISFILINDQYNLFPFAIHVWYFMRFSDKSCYHESQLWSISISPWLSQIVNLTHAWIAIITILPKVDRLQVSFHAMPVDQMSFGQVIFDQMMWTISTNKRKINLEQK